VKRQLSSSFTTLREREPMRLRSASFFLAILLQTATAAVAFDHAGISHLERAEYFAAKGNEHAALAEYAMALAATPADPLIYQSRGFYFLSMKKTSRALEDFSHQIGINPTDPTGYLSRGMLLEELGKSRDAAADFATACRLGSPDGCAWGKKSKSP
jgi:tetratricopeptide (TPR) repeat protein